MVKQYNTMHEHNYFRDNKKKNCRWADKKVNHTVKITNDDCNSTLDCYIKISSSDEEEDINHMPLSRLLKIEVEKDLLKECKNKKSLEDQLYDKLIKENNQDMLNISNNSNNIISENHPINNGEQSKTAQIVPLTNDSTIIKNQNITNVNKKARIDHYNSNYQGVNFSLDTINPKVKKENVNVTKTSANIGGESQGKDLKTEFVWHEEELNQTEQIKNEYDESDSTIDWYRDLYSSDDDEEEDIKHNMPLSQLLKIELEKDLFKELRFS
ncbi:protein ecdysoneless homolog [Rhopalosiphum padi]|uniref:protein ecdysoneless homolog n=1 Tax=Rhopalosiphum padi TaxID=40932 RepID=UPI00298E07E5|nr:protein ecdysoneless homolog [Rhopalosiphum padi]